VTQRKLITSFINRFIRSSVSAENCCLNRTTWLQTKLCLIRPCTYRTSTHTNLRSHTANTHTLLFFSALFYLQFSHCFIFQPGEYSNVITTVVIKSKQRDGWRSECQTSRSFHAENAAACRVFLFFFSTNGRVFLKDRFIDTAPAGWLSWTTWCSF